MIKDNIVKIKGRVALVCSKINRDLSGIKIVAVSKGRGIEDIKEAIACGITDIGENRVQEAITKYNELRTGELANRRTIEWHMIGHLQTNKVKDAVGVFDLIHSVDSLALAREIDKRAARINKIQDILIEIKTSREATKFGLNSDKASEVIQGISQLQNINIKGLMTIAPVVENPEGARPYFRMLKELRDRINNMQLAICHMRYLSMGMTDDFEVAIEEGADMIRIGRAIFD
ncbi:MAG: YggS family pyridoxal phosphate-dependent enzyme [Candidatus Omnitrophica bacterium CG23_combo_of_CG06-09_8_20_14_all_41_10]|uniref:Pyridoxal phosphate homeostasis protein n=1 Tax=Candidatus Sherwoodlollariibacterium unditelluris TaxID=1974757 RepID=A0A2G9YHZ6_9BACT|nr:MAG: YggS family pyridoxal phosphate-dependent enzyme [Candidatus Omnitrophica bacterium CG23_combo_of_CG06-09_8_20_14_all_41_10]